MINDNAPHTKPTPCTLTNNPVQPTVTEEDEEIAHLIRRTCDGTFKTQEVAKIIAGVRHRSQETARSADVGREGDYPVKDLPFALRETAANQSVECARHVAEDMARICEQAASFIEAALTTPPADERQCRHCNGADPHCSVCEGVGSLPNAPSYGGQE